MKRAIGFFLFVYFFLNIISVSASETNGTIVSGSQYAWGENMGWINFAPETNSEYSGLHISDTAITGYAWSAVLGWINFSPTNSDQGVLNTKEGHLSGSAWVAGLGWLSMDGVTINSSGKFTGTGGTEGSAVGRVSFDCDHCNVITDWRPLSNRQTPPLTNNLSGSLSNNVNTSGNESNQNDTKSNTPQINNAGTDSKKNSTTEIIKQGESKQIVVTSPDGKKISVDIPTGTFDGDITITITPESLSDRTTPTLSIGTFLVGGSIFNIVAKDQNGNEVHHLNKPITITIDIPQELKDEKFLGAYYLDESNERNIHWALIPDAVFKDGKVFITVDHLTRFGIFKSNKRLDIIPTGEQYTRQSLGLINWIYIILYLLIVFLIARYLKKKLSSNKNK